MYYAMKRKNEGERKGGGEMGWREGRVGVHPPSMFVFSFDIKVVAWSLLFLGKGHVHCLVGNSFSFLFISNFISSHHVFVTVLVLVP